MSDEKKEYLRILKEVDMVAMCDLLGEGTLAKDRVMEILQTVYEEGYFRGSKEKALEIEQEIKERIPRERRVIFVPPTIEEMEQYCKEKGYKIDVKMVHAYYADNGWKDARGNKVKNWKGKLNSVWFKEENKIHREDYLRPKTYGN